uniref:contactin-5 isoform X2 n=1 Tax=Jaculus jaculus TaxID=51337 RepID=UPI001E1B05DD|nr:contactin-5 isoform X2 [Jaculus jaculus]
MASSWNLILFLSVTGCLSESSEVIANLPTSYAALLRIKKSPSSSVFGSKTRPRYSSPSLGTMSVSSPSWRGASQHHHFPINLYHSSDAFKQDESVDYGPVFVQEPDDIIFPTDSEEKKVALNCEVRGNPAPTYRWLRNGTKIDLESDYRYSLIDGTFIISNPTEVKDLGHYQCLATNTFGSVLSREATLQFAYLGNFSGRTRSAVSVREGQGVVLMCSPPPHSPEIIYSWIFNEFPSFVVEDSRRFISQETGNLYISKVQTSDVGSYICLVKNTVTNARVLSPPTPLTLRNDGVMGEYEPKIEVHFPFTVTAAKGTTVKMECFALGNPVPTITWMKVNSYIPGKSRLRKSQAVLEIPNVQLDDAGVYECTAENSRGKNSFRGQLQIYTYPHWVEKLNDTQLDSGSPLHWECKATGKPRPTYRWLKNGVPLLPQSRVDMANGVLMIHTVNQSDAGMYQCLAENKYGAIYASAELKILASAPTFALNQLKKTIIVTKDREVLIECKPQGSPKPTISWKKGDKTVRENKRIAILPDGSLRILNASKADEGKYICQGENIFGSAEIIASVSVKEPTRIELTPKRTELTVGESIVLNCKAIHDPTLDVTFYWTLKGQPIDFEKEGGHFESIRAQASSADLMIRNILLMHAGRYGCRVQTTADSVSDEAELLVRGPPGPPGIVIVEEITENTATLSWSPATDNHSPISTYNLQARSPFSLGWQTVRTVPEVITGDMESAMAVDLNPWVEYEFRVVATNPIGTGDPSTPSRMIRTNEAEPTAAPTDVTATSVSVSEILVAWKHIKESLGRPQGFEIAYWKDMELEDAAEITKTRGNESFVVLTGLEANTLYHLTVRAYNGAGYGPPSTEVSATTKKSPPSEAPSNLRWEQQGSQVSLGWEPVRPLANESEVMGYKVFYRQEGHSNSQVIETQKPQAVLPLPDAGVYIIEVRAYSEGGDGTASSQIRVASYSGGKITSAQSSLHSLSATSSVTLFLALILPSNSW